MRKKKKVKKNRDCLKTILSSSRFLTRQEISLLAKDRDQDGLNLVPKPIKKRT